MPVSDLRVAICHRCRWPERRAGSARDERELLAAAKACAHRAGIDIHCRVSQCLNCCDGGHTVRIEKNGFEVAVVGIRTTDELERVIVAAPHVANGEDDVWISARTWQVWRDGKLVWHRNTSG